MKRFSIAVFATCIFAFTCSHSQAQTNVIPDDVELAVLKNIYDSLGGSGWTSATNWPTPGNWPATVTSAQFSTWKGITVSSGDISQISLSNNGLTGQLPKSISRLTKLKKLFLQKNSIGGIIPSSYGKLKEVTNMTLDHNTLVGSIPSELGNMTALLQLTLNTNSLTGSIPSSLGNLTSLDMLNVSYNQLTGSIPSTISNLTIATYLYFSNNQLTGTVPSFGAITNLKYLNICFNQLSGSLPASLSTNKEMLVFYANDNQLTGTLPDVSQWTKATDIVFGNNQITGAIPAGINNCQSLTALDGSNNQLTSVPSGLLSLPVITFMDFHGNQLTSIPDFSTQVNKSNLSLSVYKNKLDFSQLETIYNKGIKTLTYSPQNNLDDVLFAKSTPNGSVNIPARSAGVNGSITWERKLDGSSTWTNINSLDADGTRKTFQRANNQFTEAGEYHYKQTNTLFSGMTITSASIDFRVGYNQTWVNLTNTTVASDVLSKSSANGWDGAGARAKNTLSPSTDGWFEFVIDQNSSTANYMIGLADINNVYTQNAIAFGVEVKSQNGTINLLAHESNTTGTDLGAVVLGDVIRLWRIGSNLNYYKNGTQLRSVAANTSKYYVTKAIVNTGKTPSIVTSFDVLNEAGEIPDVLEIAALKAMYDSLGGVAWTNSPVWPTTGTVPLNVSNNYGISTVNGDVTRIYLTGSNVVGKIPSSIGSLSKLQQIYLMNNNLTGSLPGSIGNISDLSYLYLEQNPNISGSLPAAIGNLKKLQVLHVGALGGKLTGTIPTEFNGLSSLTDLTLSGQFTGNITDLRQIKTLTTFSLSSYTLAAAPFPSWIFKLQNLQQLSLTNCNLNGALPDSLGTMSKLTRLNLSGNHLSGSIPSSLGNLTNLQYLTLNSNQLSGSLPTSLGNLSNLLNLTIYINSLTGSIPDSFGNLSKLQTLQLNDNQLSGTIPASLGNLSSLATIDLSENSLTGAIPATLGNLSSLTSLYINNNQLTGSIPTELGSLTKLVDFQAHFNMLTGSIPSSLGNLTNLQYFFVNTNQLTGSLPPELGNLSKLQQLSVYSNQLTGSVPSTYGNLTAITYLLLYNNQLSGQLPSSLGNLSQMLTFQIYGNRFSGTFPDIFTNLNKLSAVSIANNQFTGAFPSSIGSCTSLTTLNVSGNSFSNLPNTILNLPVLVQGIFSSNSLTSVPDFSAQVNKANLFLSIDNNYLDFSELEALVNKGIRSVTYIPQRDIADINFVSLVTGSNLTIGARDPGQYSTIYWEKLSGTTWTSVNSSNADATQKTYVKSSATTADAGVYRWRMTNSLVTGTIESIGISVESGTVSDAIEFAALKDIYDSLAGAGWSNKTNWPVAGSWPTSATATAMDTWYGITVANGDITQIDLPVDRLTGKIPSSIGNLKSLKILRMQGNQISGSIPSSIGSITALTYLNLSTNNISGSIPQSIGTLPNVYWLGLYNLPNLGGTLPANIFTMPKLQNMYIYYTNVGGTIPTQINLPAIKLIYLYRDKISGTLPAALSSLTTLTNLAIEGNPDLGGQIPTDIGNLTGLTELWLNENNLTGPLPSSIGKLTNLKYLMVQKNQLEGSIPYSVKKLTKLDYASFGYNKFTGSIPGGFGLMPSLDSLWLDHNQLSGTIPDSLRTTTTLATVHMENNQLTGAIPSWFGTFSILRNLSLSANQFSSMGDVSAVPNKNKVKIWVDNNAISFADIERYFTAPNTQPFALFSYQPQNFAIADPPPINAVVGSTITITPPSGGVHGAYLYEKLVNDVWTNVTTQNQSSNPSTFTIPAVDGAEGTYRYTVTNSWVGGMEYEKTQDVQLSDPIDESPIELLYNGLITSARWHTEKAYEVSGDDFKGMYAYTYDDKYQIQEARWANVVEATKLEGSPDIVIPGTYQFAGDKFRLTGMTYDPNGNIKTLKRYDENGLRKHNFTYHYKYEDAASPVYNNQLKTVDGYASFAYNSIGQMESEDFEGADAKDQYVDYDVTGKVTVVYGDAARKVKKIENQYDDRGFRLAKLLYDDTGKKIIKTTWYIRDASGNVLSIYEENNAEEAPGKDVITQIEIPIYGAGKLGTYYPVEDGSMNYEITDHLGNVRALLRDNTNIYVATMEDLRKENGDGVADITNPGVYEPAFFENLDKVRVTDVHANHTPPSQEVQTPANAAYLNWISGMAGNDAVDRSVGPMMMLEVNVGDRVDIKTWAKYEENETNTYGRDLPLLLLSQFLGADVVAKWPIDGKTTADVSSAFNGAFATGNFANDNNETSKPFAYLNYIVFDKNLVYITGDKVRVSDDAGYRQDAINLETSIPKPITLTAPVNISTDGYIYVWVSNESENTKVWFDDLTITHTGALVAQATDYGVWGDVLREQKAKESKYRFGYQGQYAEKDDETGWSHFELREFDAMIGRWTTGDPAGQHFSPYIGMSNDPASGIDPDGAWVKGGGFWRNLFNSDEVVHARMLADAVNAGEGVNAGYFARTFEYEDGTYLQVTNRSSDFTTLSRIDENGIMRETVGSYQRPQSIDPIHLIRMTAGNMRIAVGEAVTLAYAEALFGYGGVALESVNWFSLRAGYGFFGRQGLRIRSYKIEAMYANRAVVDGIQTGTIFSIKQMKNGGNLLRWDYGILHSTGEIGLHSTFRFNIFGRTFGSGAQYPVLAPFYFYAFPKNP